jgi:hypothetical protein
MGRIYESAPKLPTNKATAVVSVHTQIEQETTGVGADSIAFFQ